MALPNITLPADFVVKPSTAKTATIENYVNSTNLHKDDVYDQLINRYGPQRIADDLMVIHGSARPVAQTVFSHWEEEWIHEEAKVTATVTAGNTTKAVFTIDAAYIDATTGTPSIRVGDVLLLNGGQTGIVLASENDFRAPETATSAAGTVVVYPYVNWTAKSAAELTAGTNAAVVARENVDFGKMGDEFLTPKAMEYTNSTMIIDETYAAGGREMTNQIWINVRGVDGKAGYVWYYRGELDARNRFENYCDISGLVGQRASNTALLQAGYTGTRGYLNDLEQYAGRFEDDFSTNAPDVDDFRTMVKHLNKYRGSKENAWYMGIDLANLVETAIAADVAYFSGGQNFGAFNNNENTFVNLGFSSMKVSNYRFALKTYDLFNHPKLLGADSMNYSKWGMVVPLDSVPDAKSGEMLPSLSTRYKELAGYNRMMEHFITGGVNGVYTERTDGIYFNYRSERAFEGVALNRHFLWKDNS